MHAIRTRMCPEQLYRICDRPYIGSGPRARTAAFALALHPAFPLAAAQKGAIVAVIVIVYCYYDRIAYLVALESELDSNRKIYGYRYFVPIILWVEQLFPIRIFTLARIAIARWIIADPQLTAFPLRSLRTHTYGSRSGCSRAWSAPWRLGSAAS